MKLTIAINTCAASPDSRVREARSSFGHGKHLYSTRADKLRDMLLEYHSSAPDVEVLVVGEWYEHPCWKYIHDPGVLKNPIDPLQQRQTAVDVAAGDFIIFLNDDHFVAPEQLAEVAAVAAHADVIAFNRRWKRGDVEGPLETGWPAYIMGHACGMHRDALDRVPWAAVEKHVNWDVKHTDALRAAGIGIQYCSDIIAWDIEQGALP